MSRYRRRRPLPAFAVLVLLCVASVVVWTKVIHAADDLNVATRCNAPHSAATGTSGSPAAAPAPAGQVLTYTALDSTEPRPAPQVQVHVLNASAQRGLAKQASDALGGLGFTMAGDPGNDPLYPAGDLACHGQIRFGANGAGAARTLSLVEPCAELVRDNRQDATVDLVIGKKFDDPRPNEAAKKALDELAQWATQQPDQHGGQQAQSGVPAIDPSLLTDARKVQC